MSAIEKEAWFHVGLATAAVLCATALGVVLSPQVAFAGFAVFAIAGLSPMFYRKRHNHQPVMDEREQQIARRALLVGYSAFWFCFVLGMMAPWAAYQWGLGPATIPVDWLPPGIVIGMIICFTVRAIAVLLQLRWG